MVRRASMRASTTTTSKSKSLRDGGTPERILSYVKGSGAKAWLNFVESKSSSCLWKAASELLMNPAFDHLMAIIIVANMVIMIIEIDQNARVEDGVADGKLLWTEHCGTAVLVIFMLELALRLFVLQSFYLMDRWNIFDSLVVAVDAIATLLSYFIGEAFPVSILRIFRLAKLARATKVLRAFPELRLMLAGLIGSLSAIFWGTVLLFCCLMVWSMMAVLFIHPVNKTIDYGDCTRCYYAYSSVMHSTLTFWQTLVAGDSWGSVTIPVIEKDPLTLCFFVPMFLTIGMAVMNLLLGVVVAVAMQSRDDLKEEDDMECAIERMDKQTRLLDICAEIDKDDTGELSRDEIWDGFHEQGEFREILLHFQITEEDLHIILTLVDPNRTGKVTYRDLMSRLYTIRNSDTEFTLAYIKFYITEIRMAIMEKMDLQHEEEQAALRDIEKEEVELRKKQVEHALGPAHLQVVAGDWEPLPNSKHCVSQNNTRATNAEQPEDLMSVVVPTKLNCGDLCAPNPLILEPTSTSLNDTTAQSLDMFLQKLANMQVQVKDMLRDMHYNLEAQALLIAAKQHEALTKTMPMAGEPKRTIVEL